MEFVKIEIIRNTENTDNRWMPAKNLRRREFDESRLYVRVDPVCRSSHSKRSKLAFIFSHEFWQLYLKGNSRVDVFFDRANPMIVKIESTENGMYAITNRRQKDYMKRVQLTIDSHLVMNEKYLCGTKPVEFTPTDKNGLIADISKIG